MSDTVGDIALAAQQREQDLPLVLCPFIFTDSPEDCGGPAALRDDDRPARSLYALE